MARLRTLKPGFFKNESLAEVTPLGRLLFQGLWTLADRRGRLEDRSRRIKAEILPYDDADADALLGELSARGFILRYSVDGVGYIQVVNFERHQQPHYKEEESVIPAPTGHQDSAQQGSRLTESDRQRIFARDGNKCLKCGATTRLSVDHITPRNQGGTDDYANLQTLCMSCNASKNNRLASTLRQPDVESTLEQGQVNESGASPSVLGLPSSVNSNCLPSSVNGGVADATAEPPARKPKKPKEPWTPPEWMKPLTQLEDWDTLNHSIAAAKIADACQAAGVDPALVCRDFAVYYEGNAKKHRWKSPTTALANTIEVQISKAANPRAAPSANGHKATATRPALTHEMLADPHRYDTF